VNTLKIDISGVLDAIQGDSLSNLLVSAQKADAALQEGAGPDPGYLGWLDLPEKDKEGYMEMFRQSRLKLRDQGLYDGKMLSFLSKVRCQKDPALAECTAKDRE